MVSTNINVHTTGELRTKAESILNKIGIDLSTAINIYLNQIVEKGRLPLDLSEHKQQVPRFGGWEGKIWMSEDFNAPMDEFKEYM